MRAMSENKDMDFGGDQFKDFTLDDLADLKECLLALEKSIENIAVVGRPEGTTYPGGYIFDILAVAKINETNFQPIMTLLETLIQFLITVNGSTMAHKGAGLQKVADLLRIAFISNQEDHREQVKRCYKVHMEIENAGNPYKKADNWLSSKTKEKNAVKILSYWCFSPGFGMKQFLEKQVRCVILTSGTLAPLKPLIQELGIPIDVRLENPHIVTDSQVFVRIITSGPDLQILNSSYENRNNPLYITSLGRTILSLCSVVPNGLLVFFPSYPVMTKCQDSWQATGLWSQMCRTKTIFVEPKGKDAFNSVMKDYYERINDPLNKGAIFMAVCRGKVSEGLDFADINGRAVVITGLPFPPLKDPRVILKKQYLQENRTKENDFLTGDEWYSLEASRVVNQAVGRVIRHQYDYGAILLCDTRFTNPRFKAQLSKWLQRYIKVGDKFGPVIGELCRFFKNAERTLPQPCLKPLSTEDVTMNPNFSSVTVKDEPAVAIFEPISKNDKFDVSTSTKVSTSTTIKTEVKKEQTSWNPEAYKYTPSCNSFTPKQGSFLERLEEPGAVIDFNAPINFTTPLKIETENNLEGAEPVFKRRKLKIIPNFEQSSTTNSMTITQIVNLSPKREIPESRMDFLMLIKKSLNIELYGKFLSTINLYQKESSYENLLMNLEQIFLDKPHLHYIFRGLVRFMKEPHKVLFHSYWENMT